MPRKGKGRRSPIMLDIKLRYIGPPGQPPTEEMVISTLEYMLATGGQVPERWLYAAIDWRHPGKGSQGFRSGSIANFAQFAPIIQKKLSSLRVAINRKPESGE